MKHRSYLIGGVSIATLTLCLTLAAQTISKKSSSLSASASPSAVPSPTANPSSTKQAARPVPFHGMVSAADQKSKTFTISSKQKSRVFKVTDKTVITKGAAAVTMKEIVENEEVSGAYWKNPDGSLEAKIVKLGPMEKPKAMASPKASPSPTATVKASVSPTPSSSPKP